MMMKAREAIFLNAYLRSPLSLFAQVPDLSRVVSFLCLAALLFTGMTTFPSAARAQNVSLAPITTTEKVGFAYYNLTRQPVPLADWVVGSDTYINMSPVDRIPYLDEQVLRLRQGYASYMPGRDFITIRFAVRIRGLDNPDLDLSGPPPGPGEPLLNKAVKMSIPSSSPVAYFPFKLGHHWIALIPEGVATTSIQPLTEDHYQRIAAATGMNETTDIVAEAELILRPIKADSKTPMVLDGISMWLMLSDVASYALLDRERRPLWSVAASWYEVEKSIEYMTLYDQ